MQMGMLTRTPRGRCVTRLAYEHLHMAVPRRFDDNDNGQQSMFCPMKKTKRSIEYAPC